MNHSPRICVAIPCYNEELTVAGVVSDFARAIPGARICVFDNASTDRTSEIAREAGAEVIYSPHRGKGNVIRHIGNVIDADIYVLVDGDGTYPADAAPRLIETLQREHVDMLVATRLETHETGSFRPFHRIGNQLVSKVVALLFSAPVTDVLSGYRFLSRDLVKLLRLRATGFEVETELTLQALAKRFTIKEVPVAYRQRPAGSHSKLSTWGDGFVILKCFFLIFKDYKPLFFFAAVAAVFALASIAAGIGPIVEYFATGLVYQIPRAVLAAGLGILATISLAVGLILGTISKYHEENIELWRQQIAQLDRLTESRRGGLSGQDDVQKQAIPQRVFDRKQQ